VSSKNGTVAAAMASGSSKEDPSGHFDFVALLREQAKVHGLKPEELLWKAAKAMFDKATGGDAAAAKLIFDRACGIQSGVNVNVDNRSVHIGPPVPASGELGEYIGELNKIAAVVGVEVQNVDADELEELLS
jgi:hypothetical protein